MHAATAANVHTAPAAAKVRTTAALSGESRSGEC
jgi:hypothetical protein